MQNKGWTVIIGLGREFRAFQFGLSRRHLFGLLCALLICLSLFLGVLLKSLDNRGDLARYVLLKAKKEALLSDLAVLSEEADFLGGILDSWGDLDRGMRIAADLRAVDAGVRALGVGGRSREEERLASLLDPVLKKEVGDLKGSIAELERQVAFQEESFSEVLRSLAREKDLLAHTPSILPAVGTITSGFGWRYSNPLRRMEFHKGVDIANRPGTPIFSPADGVVVYRGSKNGFGRFLTLDHGYGYKTRFGHLEQILVGAGERVRRGQMVARMGNTGFSTGPHLHYEVLVLGTHVNPRNYVAWEFSKY